MKVAIILSGTMVNTPEVNCTWGQLYRGPYVTINKINIVDLFINYNYYKVTEYLRRIPEIR